MTSVEAEDGPIEFVVPACADYIDLAHTRLRIKAQIVTAANGALVANTNFVGPVNNFLHSLFSNVQIDLNGKSIVPQCGLYNYRAYIENLLNYGREAKETHLTTSMFHKDTASNMGPVAGNLGWVERSTIALQGPFEMEGPIHCDLFNQDKFLLNGVQMILKFFKARPEFALMSAAADNTVYKIKILEAVLIIRKVKMSPALLIAHANTLLHHTAKYPITRVEVKNVSLATAIQSTTIDNIQLGILASRVVVCLVDSAKFNGSFHTNPFDFATFNYNYMNVTTDSALHITPYKPDFARNLYVGAYSGLFTQTGVFYSDAGSNISYDEFGNGYCLSVFDLTPDLSAHESHLSPQNSGSLSIELKFAAPLAAPVTVLVFAEYKNIIEIDQHRQVTLDYSA